MVAKKKDNSSQKPEADQEEKDTRVDDKELKKTQERVKALEKDKEEITTELAAANEMLKEVRAELEKERQAKDKTIDQLEEAKNKLVKAEEKVRSERQAHAESEKELSEVKKYLAGGQEESDISLSAFAENSGAEHPDTFVVRLAVNDQGEPIRTVIQHVRSNEKKSFPALDLKQLGRFMRDQLTTQAGPEPRVQPAPEPESVEVPKEKPIHLTDTITRLYRPRVMTGALATEEGKFIVEVSFKLQGIDIATFAREQHDYRIKVMATNLTTGEVTTLATKSGNLQENLYDYIAKLQISGLPTGLYKLLTTITIPAPSPLGSFYEGPIIDLIQQKQLPQAETV